jgi:hypothetical protein
MRRSGGALRLAIATAIALGASAPPAAAYEFAVRARSIGQLYELRSFRLVGPDLVLGRRRFVQTLGLDIWDIGGLDEARRRRGERRRGPTVAFTGYLRLDNDFGDWTLGQLRVGDQPIDAIDAVPELAGSAVALDLLYGYVSVDDLGGRVDLRIGRQLSVDALDWWSMDGVTARVRLPGHVLVEVFGGLRVRDASPLGAAAVELDGTGGADCREYVEGASPGTGSWQLIDRSLAIENDPLRSDLEYCPQREQLMPTGGIAVEAYGLRALHARAVYRRSQSPTVGLIGDVDRLQTPDLGLFPDDFGQAPDWGVNEERIAGEVRYHVDVAGGRGQVAPWAAARWSLVHGLLDEAAAGVRVRWGDHAVEPEVGYAVPTFDGDSIFNVFAVAPTTDARLSWQLAPRGGRLRANATGWLRRYHGGHDFLGVEYAAGATAGGELALGRLGLRLDLVHDDGYGGRRTGGTAIARWRQSDRLTAGARLSLLDVASDASASVRIDALTGAAQTSASWQLADGVAVHLAVEGSSDRYTPFQVRTLGVLDLAFQPEM